VAVSGLTGRGEAGSGVARERYRELTVVALLAELGVRPHAEGLLGPLVLIGVCAAAGALLLPLVRVVVRAVVTRGSRLLRSCGLLPDRRMPRGEGGAHGHCAVRGRLRRWRRVRAEVGAERRARALMSELCPHGWRAELTLYEGRASTETGEPVRAPVALDWYELRPGGLEPAVVRRVWARSVAEALEAMVADRRTDVALEQIELRASAEGATWPDA